MTSLFRPDEQPTETTFSTRRIYTHYPSVTQHEPAYELSDMTLSQTLALIKYVGMCGYLEFDSIHIVLARLSKAIMVSLKHCVRADKDEYCEFIFALLRSSDVVVEKLVIRAINACAKRVELTHCHLIIKEVYNLALLIYSLTNPLNLPLLVSNSYGLQSWHGLSVLSLQTNFLLEATNNLQSALVDYYDALDADNEPSSVNVTPLKLYAAIVLESIDFALRLMETIVTNTVPTNVTFQYFKEVLKSDDVQITDIENFEKFIAHFLKVDALAALMAATPLYDLQKKLIKPTFTEIIGDFASVQPNWCTPAQMINYLQEFIDVYNSLYGEDLVVERIWDPETNVENTVVKKESNQVKINKGHFKFNQDCVVVPAFVKVFESPLSNQSPNQDAIFSPRQNSGLATHEESANTGDSQATASQKVDNQGMGTSNIVNSGQPDYFSEAFLNSGDSQVRQGSQAHRDDQNLKFVPSFSNLPEPNFLDENLKFTWEPHNYQNEPLQLNTDYIPTHKKYAQVYELNERVALEVRTMRADAEKTLGRDRVWFRDANCLKCKFVPWHKHKFQ